MPKGGGERDTGPAGIPASLRNAPALAAALLQSLNPLNAKLSVFLPKPGRVCEGSGRMAASPPLPRQQGGTNLKESTKAPFPSAAELPVGTEHGRHCCPSGKPQPRGWVRLTHIFFLFIYFKKRENPAQNASAYFIDQLSLPSGLSTPVRGDTAPVGFQPGLGVPRAPPFPAAEECQEHLWSFASTQTTQHQQTQAGLTPRGRSLPSSCPRCPGRPLAGSKGQEGAALAPAPAPARFRKAGWCRRGQGLALSPRCRHGAVLRSPLPSLPRHTRTRDGCGAAPGHPAVLLVL